MPYKRLVATALRLKPRFALAGILIGFAALLAWVSALPVRLLDVIVLVMFAVGLGLSCATYLRGCDPETRRLSVIGVGINGFGVVLLAILLACG